MPTPTIKTKIAMDGEKEYKAALSDINSGLKVLDSEMKMVSSQFLDNGKSLEALTAKQDVLNRQIASQKEKIETLKSALQSSAQAYGESDSRTMKWKTSLNNAEAALFKLNKELSDNERAIKDAVVPLNEFQSVFSKLDLRMEEIKSELSKNTAEFAENANSVEALTEKQDILCRQYEIQKTKVEQLSIALEDAAFAYGENDTRVIKLRTSLNNAEADLAKLNHQLRQNNQALEASQNATQKADGPLGRLKEKVKSVSGETKGLGDVLGDVSGKLGVNLPGGAVKALNSLGSINPATVAAAGGFAALAAAIIKVEKAFFDMVKKSASAADSIITLSAQTGLSTKSLQEFSYASELLDVSVDTLQGSLTKLTNNMQTAAKTGQGDVYDAFVSLGVSITNMDGSLRSANDVFYDAIDRLGQIENITERDALSMDIFGKSAQDLNPLIIQGSEALVQYAKEANDLGYVMDNEMLAALGAVDDAQQRLLKTQEAVSNQISAEYAPYMEEALGDTADFIKKIGNAFKDSGIVQSFGSILTSVTSLLSPLADLSGPILSILSASLKGVSYQIALIADAATVLHGILTLDMDKIKTGLGLNISSGQLSAQQKIYYGNALNSQTYNASSGGYTGSGGYIEAGTGKWIPNNASGHFNFPGGLTSLSENGPEVVELPRGTRIYTNQESRQLGGDTYYIIIDAKSIKEFNDIVEIARSKRRKDRM